MCPILIKEFSELLVIEIKAKNREIRVISGYGPQESWPEAVRLPFFVALEEEIAKAELLGKSLTIEMDSNSKLGKNYIESDPHDQTPNGQILAGILDRHGLVVLNGVSEKCKGSITRNRVTVDNTEESIIDHVIISDDLKEQFVSLMVDEERNHILTKVTKSKRGIIKTTIDHNVLVSKFELTWSRKLKPNIVEMYNLKAKFKVMTDQGTFLSEVFNNHKDLNIQLRNLSED